MTSVTRRPLVIADATIKPSKKVEHVGLHEVLVERTSPPVRLTASVD